MNDEMQRENSDDQANARDADREVWVAPTVETAAGPEVAMLGSAGACGAGASGNFPANPEFCTSD